jgi:hypothetical protein
MRRFSTAGLLLAFLLASVPLPQSRAQRATTTSSVAPTASTASVSTINAELLEAAENITAAKLREDLYVVASDTMAGRDTPSQGLDETAKFIAARLAALKIKPAGDNGTYFQNIELHSFKPDTEKTTADLSGRTLKFGQDFFVGNTNGSASGALVYAGHGYVVKSKNINAYQGLDVRDKIIVVAGSVLPAGVLRSDLKGAAGGEWDDAASYARKNGARGLVVIPRNIERYWRLAVYRMSRDTFRPKRLDEAVAGASPSVPTLMPSVELVNALFAGEKSSGEEILKGIAGRDAGESFALDASKKLSFNVSAIVTTAKTQNVVGVLEGRDGKLKKEYVALGAHYDHVGTGRADKTGDIIYNGADDDGSGTVSILALAEAFARGRRPRRSILFVWHCGEEKGLWGSEYFTEFPTVPLKQVVAQLNIDMIGRGKKEGDTNPLNRGLSGPNEIYVIGSKEMSTGLGELSDRLNRSYLNINFNYLYDDPNDLNRFFFRSDHYNYAKKGVPIIFYFDGEHEDYHKPSDTPDKIDYSKMERIVRTIFVTGSEIANAPKRPLVDKPLTPERMDR